MERTLDTTVHLNQAGNGPDGVWRTRIWRQAMGEILIIDDDAGMRRTMGRILESAGYDVVEAENGRVGLEKFLARHPRLVVTDLLMPAKDGLETIRDIRKSGLATKILATSGGWAPAQ